MTIIRVRRQSFTLHHAVRPCDLSDQKESKVQRGSARIPTSRQADARARAEGDCQGQDAEPHGVTWTPPQIPAYIAGGARSIITVEG